MAVETGILLESGTNELELLEFVVGNQHYGINVAKIVLHHFFGCVIT